MNDRVHRRKALFALEINLLTLNLLLATPLPPHLHLSPPPSWLLYSTQRDDGNENTSYLEKNLLILAQCNYGLPVHAHPNACEQTYYYVNMLTENDGGISKDLFEDIG